MPLDGFFGPSLRGQRRDLRQPSGRGKEGEECVVISVEALKAEDALK